MLRDLEEDEMKKQELISIEEQLYAKGIWKRPVCTIWDIRFYSKPLSAKKIKKLYLYINGDLAEYSVRYLYG